MQYNTTCRCSSHLAATRREWHHKEVRTPFDAVFFGSWAPSPSPSLQLQWGIGGTLFILSYSLSIPTHRSTFHTFMKPPEGLAIGLAEQQLVVVVHTAGLCRDCTTFSGRRRRPTSAGSVMSSSSRTIDTQASSIKCLPQMAKKKAERFTR